MFVLTVRGSCYDNIFKGLNQMLFSVIRAERDFQNESETIQQCRR